MKKIKEKKQKTVKTELAVSQESTPAVVIQYAIQKGASVEELEKLLVLQERFEANEAKKAYHAALANFRLSAPETVLKNKPVDYVTKTGARVKYKHATLAAIVKAITSGLSKHSLSVSWPLQQQPGSITVSCKITHGRGYSESFSLSAAADDSGGKNAIQALGSTLSYLERYTLLAAIGLATEDQDDDGITATPIEYIDKKEQNQLLDYIAEKNVDMGKFCNAFGIPDIEQLPKNRFQQALVALQNRKMAK